MFQASCVVPSLGRKGLTVPLQSQPFANLHIQTEKTVFASTHSKTKNPHSRSAGKARKDCGDFQNAAFIEKREIHASFMITGEAHYDPLERE